MRAHDVLFCIVLMQGMLKPEAHKTINSFSLLNMHICGHLTLTLVSIEWNSETGHTG